MTCEGSAVIQFPSFFFFFSFAELREYRERLPTVGFLCSLRYFFLCGWKMNSECENRFVLVLQLAESVLSFFIFLFLCSNKPVRIRSGVLNLFCSFDLRLNLANRRSLTSSRRFSLRSPPAGIYITKRFRIKRGLYRR